MNNQDRQFLYEHLKEAYYFQIECLYKIRDRIAFVAGFLLLLGSAHATLLAKYEIGISKSRDAIFWFFSVLGLLFLVPAVFLTAYCLIKGFKYAFIPDPARFPKCASEWEEYNNSEFVIEKVDIEQELKKELIDLYAWTSSYNLNVNSSRNALLTIAMRAAFICGILFIPPAMCHLIGTKTIQTKPISVQIINSTNTSNEQRSEPIRATR